MRILPILFLASFLTVSCTDATGKWEIVENEQGVRILEGADSVLFYQRAVRSQDGQYPRNNYIHPLYSLDNTVLTEDFPEDHLHHRGVFWAWHQNYVGDQSVGDAWAIDDFAWNVADVQVKTYPDSCVLQTEVLWQSPRWIDDSGDPKPLVHEEATIVVHPARNNYRIIDFRIALYALEDSVSIGGSEDEKGYSGFSWRIPLPEEVSFTGEKGEVEPRTLALDAGSWMDIAGDLDGLPGREGVVVLGHPDNPGHPQPWILRRKGSMQNVAYPGRERALIPKDQPLILRYRMIIYKHQLGRDVLNESW